MASNLKAYEIRFRNSPRGKVCTVTQFHESADGAHFDGMRSIQQYEPRASFISVREVTDPRGNAVEAEDTQEFMAFESMDRRLSGEFYARDAETGEWEAM